MMGFFTLPKHQAIFFNFTQPNGPNEKLCKGPAILHIRINKAEQVPKREAEVQPSPAMTLSRSRPCIKLPALLPDWSPN
jgi:hypothetical protein